jgi:RNA polymerase sigma-70 factor (ECF subfamily)
VVYNGLRKIKRFRERETDLDDATPIAASNRQAEPDLKVKLKAAIESLPEGYRTVFVMHDVEGYTHEEIAQALGVQEGRRRHSCHGHARSCAGCLRNTRENGHDTLRRTV